jgi:DEAD/DEAH box helicase domain-containing protein
VPDAVVESLRAPRVEVIEAVRALGTALHAVACVGLMTDPRDVGRTLGSRAVPGTPRQSGPIIDPTLFLYDSMPGGVGLASRLFDERDVLLGRARRLIEGCGCEDGCPGCIGLAVGDTAVSLSRRRRELVLALLTRLGVAAIH